MLQLIVFQAHAPEDCVHLTAQLVPPSPKTATVAWEQIVLQISVHQWALARALAIPLLGMVLTKTHVGALLMEIACQEFAQEVHVFLTALPLELLLMISNAIAQWTVNVLQDTAQTKTFALTHASRVKGLVLIPMVAIVNSLAIVCQLFAQEECAHLIVPQLEP